MNLSPSRRFNLKRAVARAVTWCLGAALIVPSAEAQPETVDFSQLTRPVARVTESDMIRFITDELLIVSSDTVVMLEVIDITANGFGPDDVLVTYPTMETFKIDPMIVTDTVQTVMGGWAPETEFRIDAGNGPAALFDPELVVADTVEADTAEAGDVLEIELEEDAADEQADAGPESASPEQRAERAIMHELLLALERNYGGTLPVSIRFDRSTDGFTFQMWDYDSDDMAYVPRPSGIPDTTTAYDLLYLARHDSVVVTDTTLYDVIYLYKTVEDVVYTPGGSDSPIGSAPARPAREATTPPTGNASEPPAEGIPGIEQDGTAAPETGFVRRD